MAIFAVSYGSKSAANGNRTQNAHFVWSTSNSSRIALVNFYDRQVAPRLINALLSLDQFERRRAATTSGLAGTVVEIGFGSGLSVPHYPKEVHQVFAVDPSEVGKRLAAGRVAHSGVPITYVGLSGENLPLDDASVDHALSTWTLCSIPDAERALRELLRVLRPGGSFHFIEHGRSPHPQVARWQDRLTPVQRRLAGGCHLNRRIDEMVTSSGFDLVTLSHPVLSGPKVFTYMYEGIAVKPS